MPSGGPRRGTGCSFVEESVKQSSRSGAAPLNDQVACWWKRVASTLSQLERHSGRDNGRSQLVQLQPGTLLPRSPMELTRLC
eukprot:2200932-Pyramimonas_sp.AAC.1